MERRLRAAKSVPGEIVSPRSSVTWVLPLSHGFRWRFLFGVSGSAAAGSLLGSIGFSVSQSGGRGKKGEGCRRVPDSKFPHVPVRSIRPSIHPFFPFFHSCIRQLLDSPRGTADEVFSGKDSWIHARGGLNEDTSPCIWKFKFKIFEFKLKTRSFLRFLALSCLLNAQLDPNLSVTQSPVSDI